MKRRQKFAAVEKPPEKGPGFTAASASYSAAGQGRRAEG